MSAINVRPGRRYLSPQEKFEIVLESMRPDTTLQAVCERHHTNLTQINRWRRLLREGAPELFVDKRSRGKKLLNAPGESPDELKKIIGDLVVQNEILKKVPGLLG